MSLKKYVVPRRTVTKTVGWVSYVAAVLLWTVCGVVLPVAQAAEGQEELLAQKPFVATNIAGMALTKDAKGVPYAVTIPQGLNTTLEVVNLKTMQRAMLEELRTDGKSTVGQAIVTADNKHVYVGTSTGFLYEINPDKLTATEHTVPETPRLAFHAAVRGENNVLYFTATTAAGAKLYAFTIATGTWREVAAIPEATAGAAFYNGQIFMGSKGQKPQINVMQTGSGAVTTLPLTGSTLATADTVVESVASGLLYVSVKGETLQQTLVYDISAKAVVDSKPYMGQISKPFVKSAASVPAQATQPQSTSSQPQADSTAQSTATQPVSTQPTQQTTTSPVTPSTNGQAGSQAQNKPASQSNNQAPTTPVTPTTPPSTTQPTSQDTVPAPTTPVAAADSTTPAPTPSPTQTAATSEATPQFSKIFYGALGQYDPNTRTTKSLATSGGLMPIKDDCWLDETRCVVYGSRGSLGVVSTLSRSVKLVSPSPIVGSVQATSTLVIGDEDMVYGMASAPGAGVMQMDPDSKIRSKIIAPPAAALTSILPVTGGALAGTADGVLARYNTKMRTDSPAFSTETIVGKGPVTALAKAETGVVAFAINESGAQAAGMVGLYDYTAHKVTSAPKLLLPGQTIQHIAYKQGVVYGGTSDGVLFAYTVATGSVVSQPTPGAKPIRGLVVSKQGVLYGVTDTTLFAANLQTLQITKHSTFAGQDLPASIAYAKGKLVASLAGKVYAVAGEELRTSQVASGSQVALNSRGDYYYTRSGALYRLVMPPKSASSTTVSKTQLTSKLDLAGFGTTIGVGSAAIGVLLLLIPILRLLQRRPTYSLQR